MKKYNIFIIIILFFYIYEPPIINFNILHIIGGISWIYIIFMGNFIHNTIKIEKLYRIYFVFTIIWIYLLLIVLLNGGSILETASLVFWMIDIIPTCIMFCIYFAKKKYSIFDFFNILIIIGIMQSLTGLGAFLVSGIQDYFVNRLISYGYGDVIRILSSFRIYGFASNLTYSTPIVQSVLSIISIYMALNKNWKYILCTPLLFFSAIINSRTTIIIIIIGLAALIITAEKFKFKTIFKFVTIAAIIITIAKFGTDFIETNTRQTYIWIVSGTNEVISLFKGDVSNGYYFSEIFNSQRYIIPNNINLLFGVGQRIMNVNLNGDHSDIGYINDIWLGGLTYCLMIYAVFGKFICDILKTRSMKLQIRKFLFLFLAGTFILGNIKGYIFSMNNYTNLFFLIYTFVVLRSDNENSNDIAIGSIMNVGT